MSKEQDQIFFRNFSLVVGAIAVMMVVFFVMAHIVNPSDETSTQQRAEQVAAVTEPVGQVAVAGEEEAAAEEMPADTSTEASGGSADGETVFNGLCVNCHGVAALASMIPQAGDAAAWGPRIEKGIETLYKHALHGFTGDMGMMPAKGGNPALSDDEVKAAVDYIVSKVQ